MLQEVFLSLGIFSSCLRCCIKIYNRSRGNTSTRETSGTRVVNNQLKLTTLVYYVNNLCPHKLTILRGIVCKNGPATFDAIFFWLHNMSITSLMYPDFCSKSHFLKILLFFCLRSNVLDMVRNPKWR